LVALYETPVGVRFSGRIPGFFIWGWECAHLRAEHVRLREAASLRTGNMTRPDT